MASSASFLPTILLVLLLSMTDVVRGEAATCPPAGYASKSPFNPATYFAGRWYTLMQIPVAYQPESDLYCVTADYKIEITKICQIFRCDDTVVRVDNAANSGGVTGPRKAAALNGIIKDPKKPAEVSVGPRFLPPFTYGPYWVIAAGSYDDLLNGKPDSTSDKYEWAIITSGKPEVPTTGGCLPGVGERNPKGFWLLSRKPIVAKEITAKLVERAAARGLDVSALKAVAQDGCTY